MRAGALLGDIEQGQRFAGVPEEHGLERHARQDIRSEQVVAGVGRAAQSGDGEALGRGVQVGVEMQPRAQPSGLRDEAQQGVPIPRTCGTGLREADQPSQFGHSKVTQSHATKFVVERPQAGQPFAESSHRQR